MLIHRKHRCAHCPHRTLQRSNLDTHVIAVQYVIDSCLFCIRLMFGVFSLKMKPYVCAFDGCDREYCGDTSLIKVEKAYGYRRDDPFQAPVCLPLPCWTTLGRRSLLNATHQRHRMCLKPTHASPPNFDQSCWLC